MDWPGNNPWSAKQRWCSQPQSVAAACPRHLLSAGDSRDKERAWPKRSNVASPSNGRLRCCSLSPRLPLSTAEHGRVSSAVAESAAAVAYSYDIGYNQSCIIEWTLISFHSGAVGIMYQRKQDGPLCNSVCPEFSKIITRASLCFFPMAI